jgi:hypothetical protein
MIKKLLSTFLFASSVIIASAQCTPDVSCVPAGKTYGICPDSTTGLKTGIVGTPYSETVSLMIPANGADLGQPSALIKDIQITSVDSLAPGLSYTCSISTCIYPGNSTGCILISGTPTQVWNKRILVKATAHVTVSGIPINYPQEFKQYRSIVEAPTGIEQLNLTKFDVGQNAPNPFNGKSEIHFNAVANSNIDFKVYNMLGSVVYSNNFKAEKGQNIITIEANSFAPGVYVYSVGNAERTITKRMIVAR